jgi:hypothetical protein
MKKCVVLQVNDAAVRMRLVIFGSKVLYSVQLFCTQIAEPTGRGEGREERGATPLTYCVGCRSSGLFPQIDI